MLPAKGVTGANTIGVNILLGAFRRFLEMDDAEEGKTS